MKRIIRVVPVLAIVSAIVLAVHYRSEFDINAIELWMAAAGVWAPLAFITLYAMATVLFLPGSALTLAGGALFGPIWGVVYSLTGATLGAALAFLVARHLASDWVGKKVGGKLEKLYNGVAKEGWRFVAFTRLVPVFPFNLLNYALGLTRIKFSHYVIATFIFMAPGGIAYTYLGYAGKEALAGGEGLIQKILIALGLLALATFLPGFIKRIRMESRVDTNQGCDLPEEAMRVNRLTSRDKKRIEKSILKKYEKVAVTPDGLFKYPVGLTALETL
ncbi:DedA family protein, putative, partial [hydrothermal vent metagenome]